MERVNKGENYWSIRLWKGELAVFIETEEETIDDRINFNNGNYFMSRTDAETVLRKIRKVFQGADVIPPLGDINIYDIENNSDYEDGVRLGWQKCYNWIKSKIVK